MGTGAAIFLGAVLGSLFSAVSFMLLAGRYKVARRMKQGKSLLEDLRETQERETALIDETRTMLKTQSDAIESARQEGEVREERFRDFLTRAERALEGGREIWTRIETREAELNQREESLQKREQDVVTLEEALAARELELSQWTEDQAQEVWLDRLTKEHAEKAERLLQAEHTRLEEQRHQIAQRVLITAMQRQSIDQGLERCLDTIELPNETFKMRLIGREGRNARTFQRVTGVDLIIDETPGFVLLSSFDPLRRAIAARTLKILFMGGPIHPTRIEEANQQAQLLLDEETLDLGRKVCQELAVGPVADDLCVVVGRLNYYSSYGQNLLQHSLEVARLASHIAAELGMNEQLARRCGLMHDIGRALEQDLELAHEAAGAEFAEKFGEKETVCRVIAHHHKLGIEDPILQVVQVADQLSAQRPGARSEAIEKHVKRLEKMEKFALEYPHVEAAFAFDAGRELRIFVNGQKIYGRSAQKMVRELTRKIEQEFVAPGPVKVSVVSEVEVSEEVKS